MGLGLPAGRRDVLGVYGFAPTILAAAMPGRDVAAVVEA